MHGRGRINFPRFVCCVLGTIILFSLLLLPLCRQAHAARFSGQYLLQVCGSDAKGKELLRGGHIACQAYIAGVLDYHNLIHSLGTSPSVDFCVPEGVSLGHLQKIVSSYIYKHKDQHDKFVASPGVALALFEAYPCKNSKKK